MTKEQMDKIFAKLNSVIDKDFISEKDFIYFELVSLINDEKLKEKIIHKIEHIKECIKSNNLGLTQDEKIELIIRLNDKRFLIDCINEDALNFDETGKVGLVLATKNKRYIYNYIKEHALSLSQEAKKILMLYAYGVEFLKSRSIPEELETIIEIPQEMTVGVEIESEGKFAKYFPLHIIEGWSSKEDFTLNDGVEVVSPKLTACEKDTKSIYIVCNALEEVGQKISKRCGGHIHIGAKHLKSKMSYVNLLTLWGNTEELIYEISNPAGEITREKAIKQYAEPISGKIEESIEAGKLDLDSDEELEEFIKKLKDIQKDRFPGINFANIGSHEKNTIEFRIPNGTIEPETWIQNINLFAGIVGISEELTQIQNKSAHERTEEESRKLKLFEVIALKKVEERELLEALLELAVGENRKEIYMKRFELNHKLLEQNIDLKSQIEERVAKRPITPKMIEKAIFESKNPTTGVKMQEAENRLYHDREIYEQQEKKM